MNILHRENAAALTPPHVSTRRAGPDLRPITIRPPTVADGPAVTALIAACPPLDLNSAYCNLLQCSHFADSCVVAEQGDEIIGWVSGHRPPKEPQSLFIWQVAIASRARGQGLAGELIAALLERPSARDVTHLLSTVTADNLASWALFEGFARRSGAPLQKHRLFDRQLHFGGLHDTEWLARIGPLPTRSDDINKGVLSP